MPGSSFASILAFVGSLCFLAMQAQVGPEPSAVRPRSAEGIRETYNFHFGQGDISAPGNVAVDGNDFIQPGAFPTAQYCGHCHQEAYSQWRQSLHSNSFRTPFYRASVNILLRTKGIEFTRHCDSCHNPIGVLSGALTQNANVDRKFDADGLTCMTCHSVGHLQATAGNAGLQLAIPAVMVDENGKRIPGEVADEEILKYPKRHAVAVMQDFYKTPEFCAACHKANLPNSLNDYKWLRAFSAYDEWQNSKFSRRNPLTFYQADFITCQGCHMKRDVLTLKDPGAKNNTLVSHRWPAGNTAVPFYYGFDDQLKKTIEFLKSGNYLNVDLFGIRIENNSKLIAPLGSVRFKLAARDLVEVTVVVQNKNIGHSLIPEVRDLYEGWVDFQVQDGAGKEVYRSGFLKPDGTLDEQAHSFTNRLVSRDNGFVDNHQVWTIHSVAYDNTVPAGRSSLIRYEFRVPADAKGPLKVTARVNYRHLRQSYLNNVLGEDHPAYPIVELASRSRFLNLGDNLAAGVVPLEKPLDNADDNPQWMRWNNLGIAYLDQQQYAEASEAFHQVVLLRPDYADGYTNAALTNIAWQKYAPARDSLERALAIKPNDARALYYLALLERRAGNSAAEVADLKQVVQQYPQSRDARRDLGISYYQQHKNLEAVEQFEALQEIDSDDLAAHYNLAILYHRLGMDEKAAAQAALFALKKFDPAAPTNSLDFLHEHPEISIESVPWHAHTDSTRRK